MFRMPEIITINRTDTNSTSKHLFSFNERCCLLASGVNMDLTFNMLSYFFRFEKVHKKSTLEL